MTNLSPRTIDLRNLHGLQVNEVTTSFQLRWDNVLVLTAYDKERTLILTLNGEVIVTQQRLKEVLVNFARENSIYAHQMRNLYKQTNCTIRGYIAGHQRLVPTCGIGNEQVVYYMVQYLDHGSSLPNNDGVMLVMKGRIQNYYVLVDTCYRRFRSIVTAADYVAGIQLELHEYDRHRYGKVLETNRTYETDYCVIQRRKKLRQKIYEEEVMNLVVETMDQLYGEIDPEFLAVLKRKMNGY